MSFAKAQLLFRMAEMAAARRRGISLRTVMDEFQVEERTARRMMRQFEDLFPGVATWEDADRRRWWSLMHVPYISHRVMSESERAAIDLAIRRAERDGAGHEAKALERVRDRIVASYSQPFVQGGRRYAETLLLANGFASRPGPARHVPDEYFNHLFTAFRRPTRVEILYQGARDPEPRWRRVEPYAVLLGLRYYLVGRDADVGPKYRQFRFDRISKIHLTVEPFERDPDFDVDEYCAQAFGAFFSEDEHGPVRWRFAPSAAPVARDFVFHPRQKMTELDEGGLMVEFTASGWVEMAWHLVQWGNAVEVLEPLELKQLVEQVRRGAVEVWP